MAHELNLDSGPFPQEDMLSDISIFSASGFSVHNSRTCRGHCGKQSEYIFF